MMIVDRIENGVAVVIRQDGSIADIALDVLPDGVHEGSVIRQTDSGFQLDEDTEALRRAHSAARTKRLFGRI